MVIKSVNETLYGVRADRPSSKENKRVVLQSGDTLNATVLLRQRFLSSLRLTDISFILLIVSSASSEATQSVRHFRVC